MFTLLEATAIYPLLRICDCAATTSKESANLTAEMPSNKIAEDLPSIDVEGFFWKFLLSD
jgi:hypothetical protein